MSDYEKIAHAIRYLETHVDTQPTLDDIAARVHLSPYHFQRLFSRWAGVSPKRFLQALTVEHAKYLLKQPLPLFDVAERLGLSSTSRLHDHFVNLEAVSPGEFKRLGDGMQIVFGVDATPFGHTFFAISPRGICRIAFLNNADPSAETDVLRKQWPDARLTRDDDAVKPLARQLFVPDRVPDRPLSLLVSGTNFQIQVWRALLKIPPGRVTSYAKVATAIGHPRAARAVGSAIGVNPIAFAIPCHRVIRATGTIDGYHWGTVRKRAMLAWESCQTDSG